MDARELEAMEEIRACLKKEHDAEQEVIRLAREYAGMVELPALAKAIAQLDEARQATKVSWGS